MNILNKLGIKMENLFGLLEVDMDHDKIVLHMTKPEEELNAFSIGGFGQREEMSEDDMPEVEFIDTK